MGTKFDAIIQLYNALPQTKGDPFRIIAYNIARAKLQQAVAGLGDKERNAFIATHGSLAEWTLTVATARLPVRGW
ncbi:MAG: hypothetical protein Q8Q32_01905 [bacterium]|nr:hypothetical protein [bacterium]